MLTAPTVRLCRPALVLACALLLGVEGGAAQDAAQTWAERVAAMETPEVRRRVAAVNVGGTAALVLGRGVAEGAVRSLGDGAEALAWGAASGGAFYAAKALAGREHAALGYGLAIVAASVAENAAGDTGPLSHLRLPVGPVDLRVRTPFAREGRRSGVRGGVENLAVELDPVALVAAVAIPLSGGRPQLRRGVPVWAFDDLGGRPGYTRRGRTMGRTILIEADAAPPVLAHEMIHRIQGMQVAAVTPYGTLGAILPGDVTAADGAVVGDVRAEWFYGVQVALWAALTDYLGRWPEIEARALDEPPRPPPALLVPIPVIRR